MRQWVIFLGGLLLACATGLCIFAEPLSRQRGLAGELLWRANEFCKDRETQWILLLCAAAYYVFFLWLRSRARGGGMRGNIQPAVWLLVLTGVAGVRFATGGPESATTAALVFIAAITLGQAAGWWGDQSAEENPVTALVLDALVLMLVVVAMLGPASQYSFRYRGELRWTGVWDEPNTYGTLMGVGFVIAVGRALCAATRGARTGKKVNGLALAAEIGLFVTGAFVFLPGIIRSYSRGAWVGVLCALAYMCYQAQSRRPQTARRAATAFDSKDRTALAVIIVSLLILGGWSLRESQAPLARRVLSIVNINDLSWRRRIEAYVGALKMIGDKPLLGHGWTDPSMAYDEFYRGEKTEAPQAMASNDILGLAVRLGVPALGCFIIYVSFSLASGMRSCSRPNEALLESWPRGLMRHFMGIRFRTVYHAAAVVLLVRFWFDGGLFRLEKAALFWVLLELGTERDKRIECPEARVNGKGESRAV